MNDNADNNVSVDDQVLDAEYKAFLNHVQDHAHSDIHKFLMILNFMETRVGRGLAHSELANLGIYISKNFLTTLVEHGVLCCEDVGGSLLYKIKHVAKGG